MSTKKVERSITPAQCRAARAILDMTQSQLANSAALGLSTIVDFERERRYVSEHAVIAMRRALERAGVEFIRQDGGGAGVRLKRSQLR